MKRTHILHIVPTLYSKDARMRRQSETMVNKPGYSVTVFSLQEKERKRHYQLEGVWVEEVKQQKHRGKSKLRYLVVYLNFLLRSFFQCTGKFLKGQTDIIHVHNMPNILLLAAIIPRIFGKKLILDIHDTVIETYLSKFGQPSRLIYQLLYLEERFCCKLAHQIICVNDIQKQVLIERGIPSLKIAISMNVPDDKRFNLNGFSTIQNGRSSRPYRMVFHGTIAKRLGVDLAIRAVERVIKNYPHFEFHILGYGDDQEECELLARELNIQNHIIFHDFVPLEELPSILKTMDLGVIPNRVDVATELMLPVKLLEYVSLEIPVIAPELKAIRHYFSEDMLQYYQPENIESLAKAICLMIENKDYGKKLTKKAQTFFDRYGWQFHHMDLVSVYEGLAGKQLLLHEK